MTNAAAVPNPGVLSPRSLAFATVGAAARPEVTICALPNAKTRKIATWPASRPPSKLRQRRPAASEPTPKASTTLPLLPQRLRFTHSARS